MAASFNSSLSVLEERRRLSTINGGGEAPSDILLAERQAEMSRYLLEVQRLKEHGGGAGGRGAPSPSVHRYQDDASNDEGGVQRYHATAARTTTQMGGITMAPGAVATDAVKAAMERHRRQRRIQHDEGKPRDNGVDKSTSSSSSPTQQHHHHPPLTYPPDVGGSASRRAILVASIWRLAIGVVCLYVVMVGAWYMRLQMT